ncbi:MAG: serine hydrolase domain-containing protein, partial [Gemmatimonadaceae bacterium]
MLKEPLRHTILAFAACALPGIGGGTQASTPPESSLAQSAATPTPPLTRADLEAWLDSFVPTALRKGDIAGAVISIVRNGEVVFEKGYGLADVARRTPMDAKATVVRVASVSKTFTATAVMQLVQAGKLDLDRNVNDYLDFKIPAAFGKPITLRDLLTHTAGFEETPYKRYSPPLSLREHLLMIPDRIYPPGETPAYSNYGLELAGYIVQRVSGEPIASYVERHILQTLGMRHSAFRLRLPAALESFVAKNYGLASSPEPISWSIVEEMSPAEAPAVALATTADDMTHFMLAHLQNGRFGDVQLLDSGTLARMHAPAVVPIAGLQPIALGFFRSDYKGHRVLGHSGDGEGAHAELKFLPDERLGFFLAVNSDGAMNGFMPASFTLRATLFESFVDRYFPSLGTPQEPTTATAKEHAKLMAGEYAWSRQQRGDFQEAIGLIGRFALGTSVRANDDGTIQTPPYLTFEKNWRTQTWREVAPFIWREVGGEARLVTRMREGKVEALWTDQMPSFWIGLRVPTLYSAALTIPSLAVSTVALLVSVLAWPVAAFVRRRRGVKLQLSGVDAKAARLTSIAA